jgi:hypothetical protein
VGAEVADVVRELDTEEVPCELWGVEVVEVVRALDTEEVPCELWGRAVDESCVDRTRWHWGWAANAGTGTGTANKPSTGARPHRISELGKKLNLVDDGWQRQNGSKGMGWGDYLHRISTYPTLEAGQGGEVGTQVWCNMRRNFYTCWLLGRASPG